MHILWKCTFTGNSCLCSGRKNYHKDEAQNEGESKYCKLLHENPFLRDLWNVALTCQGWGHAGLFK